MDNKKINITLPGTSVSLLGVAFIVLKLTHVIDWSWWWVTAPFWALPAIFLVGAVMVLCFVLGVVICKAINAHRYAVRKKRMYKP